VSTAPMTIPNRQQATACWIHLSVTTGWDVRTERGPNGTLIAHFDDWHRLERAMVRRGLSVFSIDTELPGE
jgi:hypothetical protein